MTDYLHSDPISVQLSVNVILSSFPNNTSITHPSTFSHSFRSLFRPPDHDLSSFPFPPSICSPAFGFVADIMTWLTGSCDLKVTTGRSTVSESPWRNDSRERLGMSRYLCVNWAGLHCAFCCDLDMRCSVSTGFLSEARATGITLMRISTFATSYHPSWMPWVSVNGVYEYDWWTLSPCCAAQMTSAWSQ